MVSRCGPAHPARLPSSPTVSDHGSRTKTGIFILRGIFNRIPDRNDANQIS
jgi:hypothetical protein